jgi:hypothetical protein
MHEKADASARSSNEVLFRCRTCSLGQRCVKKRKAKGKKH